MATQTKTKRLDLRISPVDDAVIRAAAAKRSQSVSEFVLESALSRAEIEISDRTEVVLDPSSWDQFVADLDREPQVNERLLKLRERAAAAATSVIPR